MTSRMINVHITSGENEHIESTLQLQEESRSIIHAVVKNENNEPVEDAVVMLFEIEDSSDPPVLKPIYYSFTDQYGYFMFGPLPPNKQYVLKVWANNLKYKEFIVYPEETEKIIKKPRVYSQTKAQE